MGIRLLVGTDGFLYADVPFGDETEGAPEALGITLAALRQAPEGARRPPAGAGVTLTPGPPASAGRCCV